MTDDIVKRMRAVPRDYDLYDHDIIYEAADRIEELHRQLAASDEEIRALRDEIENLEYEMCEMENRTIEIEKLCKGKPNEQR